MDTKLTLNEKVKNLFKNDPKLIFDHFRNIGIAAVLALGAGSLRSFNIDKNPLYINDITWVCSFIVFAIAAVLMIINTTFAQISINLFFFNKTKFEGVIQKLGSAIVMYSYTALLLALTVMYSFNSANDRITELNQQQVESDRLHLNIEKISEVVRKLEETNIKLENENMQLIERNQTLNLKLSQLNK